MDRGTPDWLPLFALTTEQLTLNDFVFFPKIADKPMHEFFDELRKLAAQEGGGQALTSLTAAGAVLVSLITATIAPIVAIYVARRQIRATVASANRQKWIDSLRDTVAELTALHYVVIHTPARYGDPELSLKIYQLQNKISLLTNPRNSDHARINNLVNDLLNLRPHETTDIDEKQADLIKVCRRVLGSEWKQVIRGG